MSSLEPRTGLVSGHPKIKADHLQRLAYIYIRQSTLKQVKENLGSQAYQYQLVERAQALGWPRERIRVIDDDQGRSGRQRDGRDGFQEIVAEVSLGHVGIVFSYEVSRLARNSLDWYTLLDLAAIFETLMADDDGIYDLSMYNDRLVLGLKGTMSEAELHLLRQRLVAGRLSQVKRGEYRQGLPTGLVRQADGTVVKDPDDQVRHVIELALVKFEELGSCWQVLRYLVREEIRLPRRQTAGPASGELRWQPPSIGAVYEIIDNPAYAGAFAHGRRQRDPTRRDPARPAVGRRKKPMSEWIHLQQDVYPAYISWAQYLANRARLAQNATRFAEQSQQAQGVARDGAALLQGLVRCGQCGRRMRVAYKKVARYGCNALAKELGGRGCMSLHGPSIDEAVVAAFFAALRPAQLDALEALLAKQQLERQRLNQHWQEQLKRARYEARLAERQYHLVDPENRLVAAELERRWEEKLNQLQQNQEAYERFQQAPPPLTLTSEQRRQFQHISETLPELWPSLSNGHKKELLRSLIAQVNLKRETPDQVTIKIVWISGHYSVLTVHPPILRQQDVSGYDEMVKQIELLWQQGLDDKQMAAHLTQAGFRSARSTTVIPKTVRTIRLAHGWRFKSSQNRPATPAGYLTVSDLAGRLAVDRTWVYRRISDGTLAPPALTRHPQTQTYLIKDDSELITLLQQRLRRTKGAKPDCHQPDPVSDPERRKTN